MRSTSRTRFEKYPIWHDLEKKEFTGFLPRIKALIQIYPDKIKTPLDVAVEVKDKRKEISVNELPTEYPTCDIGTKTVDDYAKIIGKAKSIVISGPMGVYENKEFSLVSKIDEAITRNITILARACCPSLLFVFSLRTVLFCSEYY